jgi:hypothetical protein
MLAHAAYREMKRLIESESGEEYFRELEHATRTGEIKWDEVSIRGLYEALVPDGAEFVRMLRPGNPLNFREAAAVDTSVLGVIAKNLVMQRVQEAYQEPEFVFSQIIPTESAKPYEVIPKIVPLGDDAGLVPEGEDYPNAVIGSDWTMAPGGPKEGLIVPVTREAVYEDKTGQIMGFAADVGRSLAIRKEYRLIDTLIGYPRQKRGYGENYNWRGTEYAPWQLSTPWINRIASNELVDYSDMDAVMALFQNMTDPNTGMPISVGGKDVIVTPGKLFAASRLFAAAEVTTSTPAGTDSTTFTKGPNPLQGFRPIVSYHLLARILLGGNNGAAPSSAANAAKYWYVGDLRRAMCWSEQFPLAIDQQGLDSEAAFRRDVIAQFKASQRGQGRWKDPRYMVHSYDTL